MADLSNSLSLCVAEEQLSKKRCQLVKYAVDAVTYLIDAAGSSLLTEIYYLSHMRVHVTCEPHSIIIRRERQQLSDGCRWLFPTH